MWVSPPCSGGGHGLPHQELVGIRLCLCPVSLFQAQSPCDLVPCGVVPAQRDVPIPVPAADPGQLCVSARVGAPGHAGQSAMPRGNCVGAGWGRLCCSLSW